MVPGEGPQPARGMIVGEAPGFKEVELGRPFVGRSGKLLDSVLRGCGVDRAQVYVTNVVKEMPLDGEGKIRRPYQVEIGLWSDILTGEIEATAPQSILALGRTAVGALTGLPSGEVPFGSKIGNVYTAWHPSYLLHKGMGKPLAHWTASDEALDTQEDWYIQVRAWAETLWEGVDE